MASQAGSTDSTSVAGGPPASASSARPLRRGAVAEGHREALSLGAEASGFLRQRSGATRCSEGGLPSGG